MALNIGGGLFKQSDVRETVTAETTPPAGVAIGYGGCLGIEDNGYTYAIPDGTTRYLMANGTVGGGGVSDVYVLVTRSGVLKNLYTYIGSNTINGSTIIRIFKNGSTTALLTTHANTETGGKSDLANEIPVTAGDRICIQIETAGSTGAVKFIYWGFELK